MENESKKQAENIDSSDEKLLLSDVSNSLPNWWDLQIEQLKELEDTIQKRIKQLEGNDC